MMMARVGRPVAASAACGAATMWCRQSRCLTGIVRIGTEDPRMSKIVVHNGVVYTSGQTAADAGDDAAKQTAACLAKVDALLDEAGTSKSDALMATIWLKDIDRDFKAMNNVWNAWVDPDNKVHPAVSNP